MFFLSFVVRTCFHIGIVFGNNDISDCLNPATFHQKKCVPLVLDYLRKSKIKQESFARAVFCDLESGVLSKLPNIKIGRRVCFIRRSDVGHWGRTEGGRGGVTPLVGLYRWGVWLPGRARFYETPTPTNSNSDRVPTQVFSHTHAS